MRFSLHYVSSHIGILRNVNFYRLVYHLQHSLCKISLYGKWVIAMVEVRSENWQWMFHSRNLYLLIEYFVETENSGLDSFKRLQVFLNDKPCIIYISARRLRSASPFLMSNTDEPNNSNCSISYLVMSQVFLMFVSLFS